MKQINLQIFNLWKEYGHLSFRCMNRIPLFYSKPKKDCLLYVGLNPSFNEKFITKIEQENDINFNWKRDFLLTNKIIEKIVEIESGVKDENNKIFYKSYFGRLSRFAQKVGCDYEHVDIFFLRETNQTEVKKVIFDRGESLNEFAKAQIKLSFKIIEETKPKVILVINALASKIYYNEFLHNQNINENGYYFTNIGRRKIPTFLSGMLTGQRALDNYSLERLGWHIKQVINYC